MGFSVSASFLIVGIALLSALSAASGAYWKNQAMLDEAHRAAQHRATSEAHANLTLSAAAWNGGTTTETFTLTNTGTTTLDHSRFQYLFDGVISFAAQNAGYPKLNGVGPATSDLLLAGDTLDASFTLASQPSTIMVITEYGSIYAHDP